MDPLIAATRHNFSRSRLCRLPEEMILCIMSFLTPLEIQCLRRTCRIFLRFYSSRKFAKGHEGASERDPELFYPWDGPRPGRWPHKRVTELLATEREGYCDSCLARRRSPTWQADVRRLTRSFLYCSGCKIEHAAGLFSMVERYSSSSSRVCIGHEGFVSLCSHRNVAWEEVVRGASRLRNADDTAGGLEAILPLKYCRHPSHGSRQKYHGDPRPGISVSGSQEHETPVAALMGGSGMLVELWLCGTGHVFVAGLGGGSPNHKRAATPAFVCRAVRHSRKGLGEYLAPEMGPGRLMEMNCFDPNRCCCLRYSGMEPSSRCWPLTPLGDLPAGTCRAPDGQTLEALRPWNENTEGGDFLRDAPAQRHRAKIMTTVDGAFASGPGSSTTVDIVPCLLGSQCLEVEYSRRITVAPDPLPVGPVTKAWLRSVDPDSYRLTDDVESFGILWCLRPGCRNYYRYPTRGMPLRSMPPWGTLPPPLRDGYTSFNSVLFITMVAFFFVIIWALLWAVAIVLFVVTQKCWS